jgi:hypothetical protein
MTAPDTSFTPRQSDPSEPGPTARARRRFALIFALLIVLAAIGSWALFLRPRSVAPGGPKLTPTPSPTTSPSPTPDPQTSDDLNIAFRAIYAKRTLATVERRPEIVDEIYLPDCNCYELKSMIENSIKRHGHHVGYNPEIVLLREKETRIGGGNLASIEIVTQQGPYRIVDDITGNVILSDPGWVPQASSWTLFRDGPTSPWKVGFLLVEGSADRVLGPEWKDAPK